MFFVVFSNSDMLSYLQVFVNNFFIFLFQFFRTDVLSFCDSFDILSNLFRFVKNFFHFLFRSDFVLCDSLIILSNRQPFVNNYFILSGGVKMSTLNSTFFHVFIVLPFCTIRSLFYCIFSLLGSAIVRLPLLPASHALYFRSYASCFTSSSNSSPAE